MSTDSHSHHPVENYTGTANISTLRWAPSAGHDMAFVGVSPSGHGMVIDTGDGNHGMSPFEMLGLALGGCTAMDVISILQKKRQRVTAYEIVVETDRAADIPKVATAFRVKHIVRGFGVDRAAVERAVELSREKYCSVGLTLRVAVPIMDTIEIVEEREVAAKA